MKYDLLTVFVILVCITLTALVWGLAILGGITNDGKIQNQGLQVLY